MAQLEGLFENSCDECYPKVAIDQNTAVVARTSDIHFFSASNSSFEIITKIAIDYIPTTATIYNNTAVIGSYKLGVVYVYERNQDGIWSQVGWIQPTFLCPRPPFSCTQGAWFGRAIALDNNVMIVGAPRDKGEKENKGDSQGSAYVYRRNKNTWIEEAKLTPPKNAGTLNFGQSVAVKGTSIVVGDPGRWFKGGEEGAAYVYRFDSLSKSWNSADGTLANVFCDDWSYSVKLTDDEGLLILCGRYEINKGNSTVYYFVKPRVEDEYVLEQVIELDDTAQSIAVDQNAMVVFSNRVRKSRVSVMYPFVLKSNTWEKVATSDEYFPENGDNVAMSGNITLVASTENVYQMMTYV